MQGPKDETFVIKVTISGIEPGKETDKKLVAKVEERIKELLAESLRDSQLKHITRACPNDSDPD